MSFLTVERLAKRFGSVTALADVDLAVERGRRVAILGPSGSGKTTLLRLIGGFDAPDSGRITLDGAVLADGSAAMPAHRRGIGFVPQDGALFPHLSVAENIGFGLDRAMPGRAARIGELMAMVELDATMAARRPHELSGGQQQRVALARALARQPKLMLLDEPFSALDTDLRTAARQAVAAVLAATDTPALLVTHDQAEALSFADRVAVFDQGRLRQAGTPEEVYRHPRDPATARFLGEAVILPAELGDGFADCALGRVATDRKGAGTGEIMLRPEQIILLPPDGTPRGIVVRSEFTGTLCRSEIAIEGTGLPPILVKSAGGPLPRPGDRARLAVTGSAHVFVKD